MEVNRQHSQLKNGVNNCKQPYETGTMLPELNKVKCDLNKCEVVHNYDGGIGTGRIYNTDNVAASNCLEVFKLKIAVEYCLVTNDNKCIRSI